MNPRNLPITLTIVVCSCSVLYLPDSIDRLSFCFIEKQNPILSYGVVCYNQITAFGYVSCTNQIYAVGYVSRTNQVAAIGYISHTNHIKALGDVCTNQMSQCCPSCQWGHGIRVSQSVAVEPTQHWCTLRMTTTKNCELIYPVNGKHDLHVFYFRTAESYCGFKCPL